MKKSTDINLLMQKELTRKEFLRYGLIAMLGLFGVTNMLQNMHKALITSSESGFEKQRSYGASGYGV